MSNDPRSPSRVHRERLVDPVTERELPNKKDNNYGRIKRRTAETILELASHTLVMGLALGSIYLIHLVLEGLLGHDAKFFDSVPVKWIIDVADIVVIGKFLWTVIKEFRE